MKHLLFSAMAELAIETALRAVLEAALQGKSELLQQTAELVQSVKRACADLDDKKQDSVREHVQFVVSAAKDVAQADDVQTKCVAIGTLGMKSSDLSAYLREHVLHAAPLASKPPKSIVIPSDSEDSDGQSTSDIYQNIHEVMGGDDSDCELTDMVELSDEVQDVLDIIRHDIEELFAAIERWDVADIVCMTTGVIRALPTLLAEADRSQPGEALTSARQVSRLCVP